MAAASTPKSSSSSTPKWTSVRDVGFVEEPNIKFRRTMEDTHYIEDGFNKDPHCGFFAIYDGHGGIDAAKIASELLHLKLMEELNQNPSIGVEEAFKRAFRETDAKLGKEGLMYMGATAICCLIRRQGTERVLYCANAGDARAVLCRNKKESLRLSYDHKASDETEKKRITEAGGWIALGRVNGILAITRALGDHAMKSSVVAEPHTHRVVLKDSDTHLIIACDGLWDVVTDDEAVALIDDPTLTSAQDMAVKLMKHALEAGSRDNLSIIVVRLV